MSCGLICPDDSLISLNNIECSAEVTDDFGLFTLAQHYRNDGEIPVEARYVFPLPDEAAIIDFFAETGGRAIKSELMDKRSAMRLVQERDCAVSVTRHKKGMFEAYIGRILPKSNITVKIKYFCRFSAVDNILRITIPTAIPPKFITQGQQLAFESVLKEVSCKASLDMTYRGMNVAEVKSPSHSVNIEMDSYGTKITLDKDSRTDRDIVIDVILERKNRPAMYYFKNTAYYCFTPKIDVYRRSPREYVFIVDVSASMLGEKLRQVKNALVLCLKCLQEGDSFNIIAFGTTYNTFSEYESDFNDENLNSAKKWISQLEAEGNAELMRPVILACERKKATVMLFSDGHISNYEDILEHVQGNLGAAFYAFGIEGSANSDFLRNISAISGGFSSFVRPAERIDEVIIRAFNRIVVPPIKNAVVTFDEPCESVVPKVMKRIHAGQRVFVSAKFMKFPPKRLTVSGEYTGVSCVMEVQFERPVRSGGEIIFFHAKQQLDELSLLLTGDELRDTPVKKQLCDISVNQGILSEETAVVLSYEGRKKILDVIAPSDMPEFWSAPAHTAWEAPKKRSKMDEYIKLLRSQHTNGAFFKRGKSTLLYTAEVLSYLCTDAEKANLFVWQLRKAAAFLLHSQQKSNNAMIPDSVLDALEAWNKKFRSVNDEISQKVGALTFMYRNN